MRLYFHLVFLLRMLLKLNIKSTGPLAKPRFKLVNLFIEQCRFRIRMMRLLQDISVIES
jgi:hypothetical protein